MGTFTVTNTSTLPRLFQQVYISGYLRSDVYCLSITRNNSGQGTTASFNLPRLCWDAEKRYLRGASVQVRTAYEGGRYGTVFNGYISNVVGTTSGDSVTVDAASLMALADSVYLGQEDAASNSLEISYPEYARESGVLKKTGWNIKSVLQDMFSSSSPALASWRGGGASLPSQWRSKLKLGNLSVFNAVWNQVPLGDLTFSQATLRGAIDQLLQSVGYVRYYEEFRNDGTTYLQFFELANINNAQKIVKIAGHGQCIVGTNAASISYTESLDDVKTRIIALGQNRKYMITLTESNGGILPAWNEALEESVLEDPESAYKGDISKGETSVEKQRVFKEYTISEDFRNIVMDSDNFVELVDGKRLPLQVLQYGPSSASYSTGTGMWTATLSASPTKVIDGVSFDLENLKFTLSDPAIELTSSNITAEEPNDVYSETSIALTLTVNGDRLITDTGTVANTYALDGISAAGLTESIGPFNLGYLQYTNKGFPINGVEYDCMFFDGDTLITKTSAETYRNDEKDLERLAQLYLWEKSGLKTSYTITIPFHTTGFNIGDSILVVGQGDFKYNPHIVSSISYDLTDNAQTVIVTDSGTPLIVTQILEENR